MLVFLISFLPLMKGASSLDIEQVKNIRELSGATAQDDPYRTCNFVLVPTLTDVPSARAACLNDWGGSLVSINSKSKNDDLADLLDLAYPIDEQPGDNWQPTKWAWAGLSKTRNIVGTVIKGNFNRNQWSWEDGSSPKDDGFANWFRKQPDQRFFKFGKFGCKEKKGCYQNHLRFNATGAWDDEAIHIEHPYACDYKGKYVVSKKKLEWVAAKRTCEEAGLILAKIRNMKEVDELKKLMEEIFDEYDPNSHRFDDNNWIWTGGNDIGNEGGFTWIDGEEITFEIPLIPKAGFDNAGPGQHALTMNRDGLFDDSFSEGKERGFVCQCPDT